MGSGVDGSGAVVAGATDGGDGAGLLRGAGLGDEVFLGGGDEAPTWANSSLNIHTFSCPGDTPVHITPGALSSEPTPISV